MPTLSVLVLGCDGSWPGPGGACSGYLVRSATTTVLLDCGPGSFANLQHLADPAAVDAVVLSHEHPDHWTDLYGFDLFSRYVARRHRIPVFAPEGLEARAKLSARQSLTWRQTAGGDRVAIGDQHWSFSRTDHGPLTLAARVTCGGRSFGYSADSGPGWSLAELGPGLDLALCEATCTTRDEGVPGHLDARQAGQQGRAAGVGRLVVTHRWPTVDAEAVATEAAEAFGADVGQARVGEEYVV